jgi:phosphatidate cytidylyltransferase
MVSRVASALGLAVVALAATAFGGIVFALVWGCAATLFFGEFLAMIGYRPLFLGTALGAIGMVAAALGVERGLLVGSLGALGLTALAVALRAEGNGRRIVAVAGVIYGACVALPVIFLRSDQHHGLALTLWLYALVWVTDIGAFFVGRTVGGPKLWKRVSPNKTWSGLVGGTILGGGASLLVNSIVPALDLAAAPLICLTILTSLAAHAGDLLESALKRRFSVKDSSQLIPGHGGFMDRLDGFALASLFAAVALRLIG